MGRLSPALVVAPLCWACLACAGLAPILAIVAPLGLAPLIGLAMAMALIAFAIVPPRPELGGIAWILTAVGVWALLSSLWSPDLFQSVRTSLRFLALSWGGLALIAVLRRNDLPLRALPWLLLATFTISIMAMLFEYLSGNRLAMLLELLKGSEGLVGEKSPLNRGATVLMLLQWPVTAFLMRRFGIMAGLACIAVTTAMVFLGDSLSAKIAALTSLSLYVLVSIAPRMTIRAMMAGVVVMVLAAPIITSNLPSPQTTFREWLWLPHSSHHRLTIWGFVGSKIAEKPVLGWGMDASRNMPDGESEIKVSRPNPVDSPKPVFEMSEQLLPLHPHNSVLQWWLELGLPGVVGLTGAIIWLLWRIDTNVPGLRDKAIMVAMLGVAITISSISYGFWQAWWQCIMWLSAALLPAVGGILKDARPK